MGAYNIYQDIAERTQGDIYLGIVGPVRTGKSTFIKRFMELLVLPNIENNYIKERTQDELPQSGSGKTIMTTEPKFVPNEAVEIVLKDNASFKVRLIDCVGYLVKGALGHEENEFPRMVSTPWLKEEVPFEQAAELGTKKVINEHSTIGIVITTDGSITDISRQSYIEAEERVISELKDINKPFVILLNSTNPEHPDTINLKDKLYEKYDVPVIAIDCLNMSLEDVNFILEKTLFEFPVKELTFSLPKWTESLETGHWLQNEIIENVKLSVEKIQKLRDVESIGSNFKESASISSIGIEDINLGEGLTNLQMKLKENLFYEILGEESGYNINGEHQLLALIKELAYAKKEYDKVADALEDVRTLGYGVVTPTVEEMTLEEPEMVKQGNRFGMKLRASAPSLHLIRADVEAEVAPIIGTEKQSEDLVNYLLDQFENDPGKLWETNMFGKSLHELVQEGLQGKLAKMSQESQMKLQQTLTRIINEGNGGLICIIL
ncbi:stage IV sporulation protein A [Irregularibacter muris]|uniref:Stage IV sporulation protein A n=1 Tax=Irregularibacter muris TaxID=1796619 RepID=A0AAE3HD67_9FIRM|nr:stage IV sporulation protein A [Irregularibacter muris]MCR1898191.1 stage IV sporulation protein A [Irregularibacter muris]